MKRNVALLLKHFRDNPLSVNERFIIYEGRPLKNFLGYTQMTNPNTCAGSIIHALVRFTKKDEKGLGISHFDEKFYKDFLEALSEIEGFDINALDNKHRTALNYVSRSNPELGDLLISHGATLDSSNLSLEMGASASSSLLENSSTISKTSEKRKQSLSSSSEQQNESKKTFKPGDLDRNKNISKESSSSGTPVVPDNSANDEVEESSVGAAQSNEREVATTKPNLNGVKKPKTNNNKHRSCKKK